MRKWIAVPALLALAVASALVAEASTTSISASPPSGAVGETVTFTATFTSSCAGTIRPHYFTIDGQHYFGNLVMSGLSGTETLSISTLAAGSHSVKYYWQTSTASCIGSDAITYTVNPAVAPSVSPAPSPAPSPSPRTSPLPTPSPSPSPPAVTPVTAEPSDASALGYFGGAMILLALILGGALLLLARR